jgi:large subunit ribosomal protein L28
MPKSAQLFGRYIRTQGKYRRATFRKYQITRVIPNNAAGRVPSASSQMGLFHSDDFNAHWRLSAFNTMYRKRLKPFTVFRKLESEGLKTSIKDLRVTPSAMYAMDDKGGLDGYLLQTPPQELRSATGEKLRNLMYTYMEKPELMSWNLPWRRLVQKRNLADPWYARYKHSLQMAQNATRRDQSHRRFSPYFLPKNDADLYPARDRFVQAEAPSLDLWWKKDPKLEAAFRKRLESAKSFEEASPDHEVPGSFRKGEGMGGGGGQGSPRPRSKTYRWRQLRSY